jgi:TetR/AcrR family transcriptional repressor of mexJK operon
MRSHPPSVNGAREGKARGSAPGPRWGSAPKWGFGGKASDLACCTAVRETLMIDPDALSAEKRGQILNGAAIVFAQDGYEGASMSRIAREANVSKGTLYNHFESKADLFRAQVEQTCARFLGQVFEHGAGDDALESSLVAIGQRMIAMMVSAEGRSLYRMVISEAESFPELARAFYEAGPQAAVGAMSAWIARQVARGRLDTDNPDFAAEQFFALCQARLGMRYRLHVQEQPCAAEIDQVIHDAVATFLARYRTAP